MYQLHIMNLPKIKSQFYKHLRRLPLHNKRYKILGFLAIVFILLGYFGGAIELLAVDCSLLE